MAAPRTPGVASTPAASTPTPTSGPFSTPPQATTADNRPTTPTGNSPAQPSNSRGFTLKPVDIDDMIGKLLNVVTPGYGLTRTVKESDIEMLCITAKEVFLSQNSLIEVEPPVNICGDIHGQYTDLIRLFGKNGFPPLSNYLFLGDYVDRGRQNLETICLLLCYKIKYRTTFFLLRGNHECSLINRVYGFFEECNRRYQSVRLWQSFQDVFDTMPFTAVVGGKILCMHGGLSPQLSSLDQLRQISRPIDPPNPSLYMDLLWSDPDTSVRGWRPSRRGLSYAFGEDVVFDLCNKLAVDLIVRAHQVVQDGYEFFANRKLVTIFSAPHYCGLFSNAAATMSVDRNLMCTVQILRPAENESRKKTVIQRTSAISCDDIYNVTT